MTEAEIDELMQAIRDMYDQADAAYQFGAGSYTFAVLQAVSRVEKKLAELEPFMRQRATVVPVVYPPARSRKKPKLDDQSLPPWDEAA